MNTRKFFKRKIKYFENFRKCIYAFGFESSMKSWDDAQVRKSQFLFLKVKHLKLGPKSSINFQEILPRKCHLY